MTGKSTHKLNWAALKVVQFRRWMVRRALPVTLNGEVVDRGPTHAALDRLWPSSIASNWKLSALTPSFIEKEHSQYVAAIMAALEDTTIRNVALSGNYGVGKSSILQRVMELTRDRTVVLSLSTLAPVEASMVDESVPLQATTPTNQIQQEIVKQLLYREEPGRARGSRFRRIEPFRPSRALALSALTGLVVTVIFALTGWGADLNSILEPLWTPELWIYPLVWVVAGAGAYSLSFMMHGRLRVAQLSAGSAAVTLDEKSVSYFDQYLDEIVYFFQTTDRDIVIFEDIDRFNDAHIFETLRSLNTLLNASPQIKPTVRFIYAIKDSIFDQIAIDKAATRTDPGYVDHSDAAVVESIRANRTKFFDLVVPVVPFITHRSARNITSQLLQGISHTVSDTLIDTAVRFVPDMRLLKNVRNEFVVFRDRIFSGDGKKLGLTETGLFAMMLYKSTHLSDFEAIRLGTSNLDTLYARSRELVNTNIRRLEREIRVIEAPTTRAAARSRRAGELGERLTTYFEVTFHALSWQPPAQYSLDGIIQSKDDLGSSTFWDQLVAANGSATVLCSNGYSGQALALSRNDVRHVLGSAVTSDPWDAGNEGADRLAIANKKAQIEVLRTASVPTLMQHPEFEIKFEGQNRSIEGIAAQLFSRGLAFNMIRAGHIDANFTLYTSTFHGDRVGAAATNFLIHNVERNLMDENLELTAQAVDEIIREIGSSSLRDRSLFNIHILDRVLITDHPAASEILASLSRFTDDANRFLQAYLAAGSQLELFAQRLPRHTHRALSFFGRQTDLEPSARATLFANALRGLEDEVSYEIDEATGDFLREYYDLLRLNDPGLSQLQAQIIARVLQTASVKVADIKALAPPLRNEVVGLGLYEINRENLQAILRTDDELSLDQIRQSDAQLYDRVLSDLPPYFESIEGLAASVRASEGFAQTLTDVFNRAPSFVGATVDGADPSVTLDDVSAVPAGVLRPVAARGMVVSTFRNITGYINAVGELDEHIAAVLSRARQIATGEESPQAERVALARQVLSSDHLSDGKLRAQLVESLQLADYLDANTIPLENGTLFPELLSRDVIQDDEATFQWVSDADWATRASVLGVSENAASLVSESFINSDLRRALSSEDVDDAVKDAITHRVEEFVVRADRPALTALASRAHHRGIPMTAVMLAHMAVSGVHWRSVLPLLIPIMRTLPNPELFEILRALGDNFAALTALGRDAPTFDNTAEIVELLVEMRRRGFVSKFDPNTDPIRAYKKRVPR